jgi:hypothetical protein
MLRSLQNTPFDMPHRSLRENRSDLGLICDDRVGREATVQAGEKMRRQRTPAIVRRRPFARLAIGSESIHSHERLLISGRLLCTFGPYKVLKVVSASSQHKSTPEAFGAV